MRFSPWTTRTLPLLLCTFVLPIARAADDTQVHLVKQAQIDKVGGHYVFNRSPLEPNLFARLPLGSITPRGWLRHQLELQTQGMHGRLVEISSFLKWEGNGWVDPKGQSGWEELPYWLKGYGDLGYVLKDEKIIQEARRWIDAILAAQQPDGWFGPNGLRASLGGKTDMWPHMPILNALQSYYEFSGDPRILPFMLKYARWQNGLPPQAFGAGFWPQVRFGDNLETVYWLYNRTGEAWLLDLARKIHENMANWTNNIPSWHNVNIAEGFREPAEYWMQSRDRKFLEAAEQNYQAVMGKYGQFPGGGFAGDENCRPGFGDPRQGLEMCGFVEFMHSFQMLTRISGNPLWADRCEEIAFNSYPAAMTPNLKALHYLTGANLIQLDRQNKAPGFQNSGNMLAYSPHLYRCCQHNHGMGWPYYAEELWLATADGGLCASLYAASEVKAKVGEGVEIGIAEQTDYPFSDTIALSITAPKPVRFPLYLRVPRWSKHTAVKVNDQDLQVQAEPLSYIIVDRTWTSGDRLTLQLPMAVALRKWTENKDAVSVDYGPLTFSLKIGERWARCGGTDAWPEWEVFPTTPWNYGLVLDSRDPAASFEVVRKPGALAAQPFVPEAVPIEIRAKARKIPGWKQDDLGLVGLLQPSPAQSNEPEEAITLIPMGAARLRISSFPTVGIGPDAHAWVATTKPPQLPKPYRPSASHVWDSDTVDALCDGRRPSSSNDQSIPRFTWWDHRGTKEWVQCDFDQAYSCRRVAVYWFDDTGSGQCRVPQSWRVLYKDGDAWKPVEDLSGYGTKPNVSNRVLFKPVKTTALRIEAQLQPSFSGGILELSVGPLSE